MTDPTTGLGAEEDATRQRAPGPREPLFVWRGDLLELYKIFLVNVALTVMTLGLYYFWGKTRIRRYVWANMAPGRYPDDRLEYRGKGSEIFLAWLIAMVVLALAAASIYGGASLVGEWAFLLLFPFLLGLFFLAPLVYHTAKFAARRYVLSRTRWRGIRFAQTGSVWRMGLHTALRKWAQYLSMHVARPFYEEAKRRCTINDTWFGDRRMAYTGDAGPLMGPWLKTLGAMVAVAVGGIFLGTVVALVGGSALSGSEGDGAATAGVGIVVMAFQWVVTGGMLVGFAYFWFAYRAHSLAHAARHTRLEGCEFAFRCGGGELFRFELVNWVALVVSFGLAYPWVKVRRVQFTADHLETRGDFDPAHVAQSAPEAPRVGEGFAEAFGLDYPILGVVEI